MTTVDLAYSEFGHPDADPLIILHGFFASSRNWKYIAEKLAARQRVFVVDVRNHGVSPHHPVMDYPSMAKDVRRFMEQRGLSHANLLGHSMGGKIAMWLALNDPAAVDKLIVADIAPVTYSHSFEKTISALKRLPLKSLSNRKQAEEILAETIPDLSYRQFLLQNLILSGSHYQWRVNLDIFERMAPNITAFPGISEMLAFKKDSLFIAGEDSNFVEEGAIRPLFPNAQLIMLANAGHWLHVQQPESFVMAVQNFLHKDSL
jgi:esterase